MPSDYVARSAAKNQAAASGGPSSVKGARAGESFDSDAQIRAKRKADAYRIKRKKSFAWKPPAKAGVDQDWDMFDPDKDNAPALSNMAPKK